ncbi:DUF6252 family protein [Spirosoma endbachense]|uniref:Uncharacterized protein n=1 Tax=Spirosoma endbachense TaxID=2666025 RepID=A0A6P1W3T9_9BACT|nr:DUF6252 family protein [Spirosoma endbachense]QHV99564.1 hypothetical protein GJR95_33160 [Spirosoma endbachense]
MKTSRIVILLAIVGIVGISSCSKKSDDVTPNPTQTTTSSQSQVGFQVKIDGKDYMPDFAYALSSFTGANGYYAIYGLDSKSSDVVALALPNTAVEGTYPLSNVNIGILTLNKEDFSTTNGGSGTITITKKTATYMTGTFSFTAFDATGLKKRTLTAGTFNVNIR